MSQLRVVDLATYPVKGMRGNSLAICPVDTMGFVGDRRLMLVDEEGKFVTQRECAKLATIAARYEVFADATHLLLSAQGWEQRTDGGHGAIAVVSAPYLHRRDTPVTVTVWSDTVEAFAIGGGEDGVDDRLSMVLGQRVRLVSLPDAPTRPSHRQLEESPETTFNSFADAYPFLLTTVESLRDLNSRLSGDAQSEVPMDRFRPNIIVEGCTEAFEEETWQEFRIGNVTFHGMKRCARCLVTTTDQDSGERLGKEPLATLSKYRRFGRDTCFGMNLNHVNTGIIRVGDTVEIIRRGNPLIANKPLSI